MKKQPPLTDEERALFRSQMRLVTPLKVLNKTPAPIVRKNPKVRLQRDLEEVVPPIDTPLVSAETILSFRRDGIQNRVFKQLRQQAFPIEAELDLHGLRIEEAWAAVEKFLQRCLVKNVYCVCIVHGKGDRCGEAHPVLKNKLNQWLRHYTAVLAFHSALPRRGGAGAVYLLLKKIG